VIVVSMLCGVSAVDMIDPLSGDFVQFGDGQVVVRRFTVTYPADIAGLGWHWA
jgi:hypothetical protein